MTVIVAARTKRDGIVVAADSEMTAGWQKGAHAIPKIGVVGEDKILGFAGSVRTAQVIRHHTEWPEGVWPDVKRRSITDLDVETFVVREVWEAMRTAAAENGQMCYEGDEKYRGREYVEAEFLLAYGNTLVEIGSDGCVTIPPSGRSAIGSGYAEALGHLGEKGPWTREDVIEAVRRASMTAVGVGGTIYVTSTADPTVQRVE